MSVFRVCLFEKSSCITESTHVSSLINASLAMVNGLLALCDFTVPELAKNAGPEARTTLSMKRDIPQLVKLMPSPLIVPLQESLTATLPPTSSTANSHHQPFPLNLPTFDRNLFFLCSFIPGFPKVGILQISWMTLMS
jgi:serine/threonine-protein kinase ATR